MEMHAIPHSSNYAEQRQPDHSCIVVSFFFANKYKMRNALSLINSNLAETCYMLSVLLFQPYVTACNGSEVANNLRPRTGSCSADW